MRWSATGAITDLGALNEFSDSRPLAINDRGTIVGNAQTADGGSRGVSW